MLNGRNGSRSISFFRFETRGFICHGTEYNPAISLSTFRALAIAASRAAAYVSGWSFQACQAVNFRLPSKPQSAVNTGWNWTYSWPDGVVCVVSMILSVVVI